MKKRNIVLAMSWVIISLLVACGPSPDPVLPVGTNGFFIVNEGSFGNSNSSISFYDRSQDKVINDVFAARNGRVLGDQAQSMTIVDGKGFIVVQNSAKVEVINADDFSSLGTITEGLESPRYFIAIDEKKAYVSDWGADGLTGTIKIVDLSSLTVKGTVTVGKGPNKMLRSGNVVYIALSGGYGLDNRVVIFSTETDKVVGQITVGDNPGTLSFDSEGNLWVASAGYIAYKSDYSIDEANSTPSSISKITANTEVKRFEFTKITYGSLSQLTFNGAGNQLYFIYDNAVYRMSTTATSLPSAAFISKGYYGLAVDPINDNILALDAPTFSSPGKLDVYDTDGTLVKSYETGIAPNGCTFR